MTGVPAPISRRHVAVSGIARSELRAVLAQATGLEPARIGFGRGRFGKPLVLAVDDPDRTARPYFNVSHTASVFAVLVCAGGPVGIDVEDRVRDGHFRDLYDLVLSPEERCLLEAARGDEASDRFLWFWTRKEALLKASGVGLGCDLRGVAALGQHWRRRQLRSFATPSSIISLALSHDDPDELTIDASQRLERYEIHR